jgi:2-amino-4-hydroxy-6-hydroxymethyldihydropteridine diphosphokinase
MIPVALSLGSSLGNRLAQLQMALCTLHAQEGLFIRRSSRVAWTPAVGGVARASFLNAVLYAETSLSAEALLACCKRLETRLGRQPSRRFAERVIDIDILLYGQQRRQNDPLLPHPRLSERDFFLDLLSEVWPEAPDPSGRSYLALHPPQRHWPRVAMLECA